MGGFQMGVMKPLPRWLFCFFVLIVLLVMSSCASQSTPPPNPVSSQQQAAGAPSTVPATQPLFYDFPDIPIPQELSLQRDDSYVYQEGQFRAGFLTLRGRVDLASAVSFFQLALPREGWTSKGGFRYLRSVLIFEKPGKTCVINLYEKLFYTYVEIYVAPTGEKVR